LQLYKANPSFEVEEREKRGEEKNIYWSYVRPLMLTRAGPPYRG